MREMRGEVGKKTPKREIDNPLFLWRHMADFLDTLSHPVLKITIPKIRQKGNFYQLIDGSQKNRYINVSYEFLVLNLQGFQSCNVLNCYRNQQV